MDTTSIDNALERVEQAVRHECHYRYFVRHKQRYLSDAGILSRFLDGSRLLEIGAYPGHFTALMSVLNVPCIGVDIDPERLGKMAERFKLDVRRCDIEREPLPFDDASFNTVIFSEVFEHLRIDPLFALSEIHRVLAPDGHLLLTTPNLYSVQQYLRMMTGRGFGDPLNEFMKVRALGHMGHVREYSNREMRRFLKFAGFAVEQVWFKHYYYGSGKRGLAKRVIFSIVPARLRTFQIMLASKQGEGLGFQPLV